ncbi:hypothetical protein Golomagni_02566 [Golovinomyces magnicellulatus]|nr:hypothetical protein Golomagni_02566 [Golovinomyces magnicellulatus]
MVEGDENSEAHTEEIITPVSKSSTARMKPQSVTNDPIATENLSEGKGESLVNQLKVDGQGEHTFSELPFNGSQLYNSEHELVDSEINLERLDETEIQRHLNDVESSFIPVLSPVFLGKKGADDTYLFDKPPELFKTNLPDEKNEVSDMQELAPSTRDVQHMDKLDSDPDETSSFTETRSSSPAEAAAARCISRAVSNVKTLNLDTTEKKKNENGPYVTSFHQESKIEKSEDAPEKSVSQHDNSNQSFDTFKGSGNSLRRGSLLVHKNSSQRTNDLRNSCPSRQSSLSSLDGSEATLEADYALQSGGAMPAVGISRHSSTTLSRSMSLGSMASGFESSADDTGRGTSLATLTEEENKNNAEISPPETPRPPRRDLSAPTDTVIARHVRNVHVPDAVLKEYKSKNEMASPSRQAGLSGPVLGRIGKNLTLKEQSSTIERLSKENFDLKLKVMFLSDRLEKLSEESVRDMISENVELKTSLAGMQRDNKALKRKIKELEKKLKAEEDRPSTSQSSTTNGESTNWINEEAAHEKEEELLFLREKIEEYVTEIEKLRSETMFRERDRTNLVDVVRQMSERRAQDVEVRDDTDIWKDLFEQETSRCEKISNENKILREENMRLKTESTTTSGATGLNHTTNIYNITKKRQTSPAKSKSHVPEPCDNRNYSVSGGNTSVEELKKESEKLRHENVNLRREVGAQTSMLTSRNKEKERLYQEIEELKLRQQRNLTAGDGTVDRSVSRSNQRSVSLASDRTRNTTLEDVEREEIENKNAELRDAINSIKIQNQDLRTELNSCMEDFEFAVAQKKKAESIAIEMRKSLEAAETDILTIQAERDEALHGQEETENLLEAVRIEAQQEIDSMSRNIDETNIEIERLLAELSDTTENFNSLQTEMRDMSQALVRLEDNHDFNIRRIQDLEKDLEEANHELEQLEKNLVEANEKSRRLTVQQESCQGEIMFLREEQEGDKIKIGNLEAALKSAEQTINQENERVKDLSQKLSDEQSQREALAGKEKKEVQQLINQLERELTSAKDEAKRLRKKDVEAAEWKQKLVDLEEQLRTALGEIDGTRSSFLQSIGKLHHQLEDTVHDLDRAKESLAQKDRIIKERDELLESHALEARKLADILDKERQCHRNTKHQFETYQKTNLHTIQNISQQETRVIELENSRQHYRRKIINLENQLKEQMTERNQLLLTLWKRLSDLCGPDWAHDNSLINGRALPSMDSVSTMFSGFSRNIIGAVKKVESLFKDFTSRIRSVEKDLWKEYQTLESNLEARTKKLECLETLARSVFSNTKSISSEITSFRNTNKVSPVAYPDDNNDPAHAMFTFPRLKSGDKTRIPLTHHYSASTASSNAVVETSNHEQIYRPPPSTSIKSNTTASGKTNNHDKETRNELAVKRASSDAGYYDPKWATRLYELEEKYKAEREARIIDRSAARQRLDERNHDNQELIQEIERLKCKIQMGR